MLLSKRHRYRGRCQRAPGHGSVQVAAGQQRWWWGADTHDVKTQYPPKAAQTPTSLHKSSWSPCQQQHDTRACTLTRRQKGSVLCAPALRGPTRWWLATPQSATSALAVRCKNGLVFSCPASRPPATGNRVHLTAMINTHTRARPAELPSPEQNESWWKNGKLIGLAKTHAKHSARAVGSDACNTGHTDTISMAACTA